MRWSGAADERSRPYPNSGNGGKKLKWFMRKKPVVQTPEVQLRNQEGHPFGALDRYMPLRRGELELYRTIREAVPIVDAALMKLVRLCGGVQVRCGAGAAQAGLERFLREVDTGRGQRGIQSFLDQYLDSMLTCGQGVGEMVLDREGRDIAALLCADPGQIEIREGETPLEFRLCVRGRDGQPVELPWQELLLFTPFQPGTDNPYGVSLLRSMPFLSGILLKIYLHWGRTGNGRETCASQWCADLGSGTGFPPRNADSRLPGSGPPPCRRAVREQCGTLWQLEMWISKSSARTARCWTARSRCGRSWNS